MYRVTKKSLHQNTNNFQNFIYTNTKFPNPWHGILTQNFKSGSFRIIRQSTDTAPQVESKHTIKLYEKKNYILGH